MIEILYHDDHIAVAVKPAGALSEGEGKDSFPAMLSEELSAISNRPIKTYTVHRLDRETEGIMVYALTSKSAASLSKDITDGSWKKIYTALLWGVPQKESDRLCDMLYYDRNRGKSFVVSRERKGVKDAALSYQVLEISNDKKTTRVSVTLETGRTHQIRVQFASRGIPLCGDRRYGAPAESGKSLMLCASSLSFKHPITGEAMDFSITPSF